MNKAAEFSALEQKKSEKASDKENLEGKPNPKPNGLKKGKA